MDCIKAVFEIIENLFHSHAVETKDHFEQLRVQAQDLYAKREIVKRAIERCTVREVPMNEWEAWLEMVNEFEGKIDQIAAELDATTIFEGSCPNCCSHRKIGKVILNMFVDLTDLVEKFKVYRAVNSLLHQSAPIIECETATYYTMQRILRYLRETKVRKVGVWGLGGVGKTTIMKNLLKHPQITQGFDHVIWVSVTRNQSLKSMQEQVAKRLSVKLSGHDWEDAIAIFQSLRGKTFLLILEDVWEKISLADLGIPLPYRGYYGKLIVTTRTPNVCLKMNTEVNINVEVLSDAEAWLLFQDTVGEVVDDPHIEPLARDIVKECHGLPLATIVMGETLRKEDIQVWKNTLNDLSPSTSQTQDLEEQVLKCLKYGYNRLKDNHTKNCFLYGVLYPEYTNIEIAELIEYWRVEGFIDNRLNLAEARLKGHAILNNLLDSYLLERIEGNKFVKMHDLLRDMALRLTSSVGEGPRFFVKAGVGIKEPPKQEWEQAIRISFMDNQLTDLLEWPQCSKLLTLLLQGNVFSNPFPDSFFDRMQSLCVLDLSRSTIESLPPSLGSLGNLRGLFLNGCYLLKNLPCEVGKLENLDALHLSSCTSLTCLPNEVQYLTCLRSLIMTFTYEYCGNRELNGEKSKSVLMVHSEILEKLVNLENLTIDVVSKDKQPDYGSPKAVIEQLGSLTTLTSLELWFPKLDLVEHFIQRSPSWNGNRLTKFSFYVSPSSGCHSSDFEDRKLTFLNGNSTPPAIVEVLKRVEFFHLGNHSTIKKLSEFGLENMKELKHCHLSSCAELEILIDVNQITEDSGVFLPKLEVLYVESLQNLRSIWEGPVPPGSLASLRILNLHACYNLKTIFTQGMIQQLSNLEEITIVSTPVENLFIEEEIGDYHLLSNLKTLNLFNMSGLVSISHGFFTWPSLENISIYKCPNLKRLPLGVHNAAGLNLIEGEKEWWDTLDWEDEATKKHLESIFLRR